MEIFGVEIKNAIIAVVVILIVLGGLFLAFRSSILPFLKGLGPELLKETQEANEHNFDIVVQNLEACRSFQQTDCLCETFPSWPATFALNSNMTVETVGKDVNLSWGYNKKTWKNATIKNLMITAKEIETMSNIAFIPTKEIYWKENPPLLLQSNVKGYRVISGSIYKGAEKDALYLLVSKKPRDKLNELEPKLNSMKKCTS